MDIPTAIFVTVWGGASVLFTVMLVRSYHKKSKHKQCDACNGMGFEMSINTHPPQCTRCDGSGYV